MANQPNETSEESLEGAVAVVVDRMLQLTAALSARSVPEGLDWFRKMLVGILTATSKNYSGAEAVVPGMHSFSCWCARNLLELRVITAYVLRCEENALDFMDDLGADVRQFWEAMKKAEDFTHSELIKEMRAFAAEQEEPLKSLLMHKVDQDEKAAPKSGGPAAELKEVTHLTIKLGGDPNRKPKLGSKIAELVDEDKRYGPLNKVLSKIVHPTAMSIAQGITPGGIDALMPFVRNVATNDMLKVFYAIENHIKAHGIGWPA